MRVLLGFAPLLGGCATAPLAERDVVARDVAAYAMASCFAMQDQPYLRDQGERWASGVIQRGEGPIEAWTPIAQAVRAELARSGIGQGKPERPTEPSIPLPVLTCGEIGDAPAVRAAMVRARAALAADYRAREAE